MSCKYAVLAIPRIGQFPELTQDHDLGFSTYILQEPETILSTIPEHPWKEWLGSLAWEDLFRANHIVVSHCPTQTPEVLDGENVALESHLTNMVYKALFLVAPFCGSGGEIRLFSGKGHLTEGKVHIDDIRSHQILDEWVMPGCRHHANYWRWLQATFLENAVIDDWRTVIAQLHALRNSTTTYIYSLALEVFRLALIEKWADVVFPHVVRSIETLIALPPMGAFRRTYGGQHTMAKEFAARILRYYPITANHLYQLNQADLTTLLEDIYQVRSDSVHGKPLAWTLRQRNPNLPDDELMKLEYVSETAARHLLRSALTNTTWMTALADRATLEQAWLAGNL